MKTALLAVAFATVALPAFAAGDDYPIKVRCDRWPKRELVDVKLDDKKVAVVFRGRNETYKEIWAEKTFPIYRVTGKISKTGDGATPTKIALGQKLPPDNEQSWTVYFGDHGEDSLTMSLTSHNYGELIYRWKGQLNMQPGVKEDHCSISDY
ncbi:hypothetical protein Q2941_05610 [Bradyrhizobium sp. UFLA05-153]